ncbi:MAG: hypothetical protein D6772_04835 [Bacteroidetes bacterium]|nr:MAG: hypothetical protein D6772_04835 [Bacteroidota bacterium]
MVKGQFNSSLVMDGVLGQDLMPKLEELDAEGLFEVLNGSLSGLQPLMAIGNALDIAELKQQVRLDKLVTWFTIRDGRFEVKPFDLELAGLPMTIAGSHSLTQEMYYTINTVVPRSRLGNGSLGNTLNSGISSLVQQANSLGLNVKDAENLNLLITLRGSLTDPKVSFKLLGTSGSEGLVESVEGEIRNEVKGQVDEVKTQLNTRVEEAKTQAQKQAKAVVDSAKSIAAQKAEEARQAALEEARRRAGAVVDSTAIGTEAKETVDEIKNRIKDFNPFGRRRGGGGGGE